MIPIDNSFNYEGYTISYNSTDGYWYIEELDCNFPSDEDAIEFINNSKEEECKPDTKNTLINIINDLPNSHMAYKDAKEYYGKAFILRLKNRVDGVIKYAGKNNKICNYGEGNMSVYSSEKSASNAAEYRHGNYDVVEIKLKEVKSK